METKYYTPKWNELFIGYTLQYLGYSSEEERKVWKDLVVTTDFLANGYSESRFNMIEDHEIRTKFLDKQDIESEGWKFQYQTLLGVDEYNTFYFYLKGYDLYWLPRDNDIRILKEASPLYVGECKSINEFRKITKWLNIK